ncbi:MAG: phosphate acyltransferase PlsX [Clostridia bacterium]|nr:phosphate acyltransferase PlsX [Clostridia bacterium]MBQ6931231.1 phosphate acyltransferase PlsX [Clostridia bacterium]
MKIIVDAFGGDNAPLEILKGCALAVKELGVEILLVGDESRILACAKENSVSMKNMEILHAEKVFEMEYDPRTVMKEHSDTSLAVGMKALTEGKGVAYVSAGSTGAIVMGATFIVKRIKGVKRAAIASVMPSDKRAFMLLDCGANVECKPEHLVQFAQMGSVYMNRIMGYENPSVGLANIGVEENKGTPLQLETYSLLKEKKDISFMGNAEVRDIAFGVADVVVADGFTGNVILKMYEGVAKSLTGSIKAIFKKNVLSMLSYIGVKSGMDAFKKKMDYKEYGGAVLLGIAKPVIKAHGSSDARAFKNAIRQAVNCVEKDVIGEIKRSVGEEKDED